MTKILRGAIVALAFGTATACGGDVAAPDVPLGSFLATIDGNPWNANLGKQSSFSNGTLEIGGIGDAGGNRYLLELTVAGLTAPGTFPLGPQAGGSVGSVLTTTTLWTTTNPGGTGTVTVTLLTGTQILGTFSFTSISTEETGANATRTVTNGSFDIRF